MYRHQLFKHLMPRDIPPFSSYVLSDEGKSYTRWEFDVIVGEPQDPGTLYPANKRKQAMYLNALKIDAIGWFHNSPTLIEAKPDADCGAIGQIDSYADWYRFIYGIYPRKMIVCNAMRQQVQTVAGWHDILIRIVPDADVLQIEEAMQQVAPLIGSNPMFPNPLEVRL